MKLTVLLFAMLLTLNDKAFGSRISEKKCEYYRQTFSPTYGYFEESTENNFMVRVLNATQYFNGILISENFILSTVIETIENYRSYGHYVVIGDTICMRCQMFDIVEVFIHDDFKERIALYKLSGFADINKFVRPACLPKSESIISNADLHEVGWTGGFISGGINEVKMEDISDEHCAREYRFYRRQIHVRGLDDKSVFCARPKVNEHNICDGYNSAALLKGDGDTATNEILGIALRAFRCDIYNTPAVYVRLSKYVDWIESIVWPSEYKSNTDSTAKPFSLGNMSMELNLTNAKDSLVELYNSLKIWMESNFPDEIDSTDDISKESNLPDGINSAA